MGVAAAVAAGLAVGVALAVAVAEVVAAAEAVAAAEVVVVKVVAVAAEVVVVKVVDDAIQKAGVIDETVPGGPNNRTTSHALKKRRYRKVWYTSKAPSTTRS